MKRAIIFLLLFASAASAQIPPPAIKTTGPIGPGSPILNFFNSGTLILPADANYVMAYPDMSAHSIRVTSAVALSTARTITAPQFIGFEFIIMNETTGGQSIILAGPSGTGVTIPNGQAMLVISDGVNYLAAGGGGTTTTGPTVSPFIIHSPGNVNTLTINVPDSGDPNLVSSTGIIDINHLFVTDLVGSGNGCLQADPAGNVTRVAFACGSGISSGGVTSIALQSSQGLYNITPATPITTSGTFNFDFKPVSSTYVLSGPPLGTNPVPPVIIQSQVCPAATAQTISCSFPAATKAGSLVVASLYSNATVSDNLSQTYLRVTDPRAPFYYKENSASITTVTAVTSGGDALVIVEVGNIATSNSVDTENWNALPNTTLTWQVISTTNPLDMILGTWQCPVNSSVAPAGSVTYTLGAYVGAPSNGWSGGFVWRNANSTATYQPAVSSGDCLGQTQHTTSMAFKSNLVSSTAAPTFRSMVPSDLPATPWSSITDPGPNALQQLDMGTGASLWYFNIGAIASPLDYGLGLAVLDSSTVNPTEQRLLLYSQSNHSNVSPLDIDACAGGNGTQCNGLYVEGLTGSIVMQANSTVRIPSLPNSMLMTDVAGNIIAVPGAAHSMTAQQTTFGATNGLSTPKLQITGLHSAPCLGTDAGGNVGSVSCGTGTGGGMVYPTAGIPYSNGTAWGNSFGPGNTIPPSYLPTLTSAPIFPVRTALTTNTAYNISAADLAVCAIIPISNGTPAINLPATMPTNGQCVYVVNYGPNTITISRGGTAVINGGATTIQLSPGGAQVPAGVKFISDGTNWTATRYVTSWGGIGAGNNSSGGTFTVSNGTTVTYAGTGAINANELLGNDLPATPTTSNYLQWTGTAFAWSNPTTSGITYPSPAGIVATTGTAWDVPYTPTHQIPATYIATLNQNTTGTAAGLTAPYIDWSAAAGTGASILNKPTIPTNTSWPNAGTCNSNQWVNALTNGSPPTCTSIYFGQVNAGAVTTGNYVVGSTATLAPGPAGGTITANQLGNFVTGGGSNSNYTMPGAFASGYLHFNGTSLVWDTPATSGGMVWPTGGAGIPNYNGSSGWGTTYNSTAGQQIPFNFLSSTTAAVGSCNTGQFSNGDGNAGPSCAVVQYNQLGGTAPTWNQNTTGTSASAAKITANGTANQVWTMTSGTVQGWATPSSGGAGAGACTTNQYVNALTVGSAPTCSQVNYSQLAGTVPNAPTATALSTNGTANQVWTMTSGTAQGWVTPATGGLADPGANGIIKRTALNTTAVAVAADINALGTISNNTTGTSANITGTSNSTLVTLSALALPYSQLTGTVPTWNQNTTGTAAGITGNGTANQVWGMNSGGTAQGWQTAAGSSTATNLAGGVLGSVPYQSAASTTAMLAPNTTASPMVLQMIGTGSVGAAPTWTATPNISVKNLLAGSVGYIPYQSAAGSTAFLPGNTAATDQVLVSHGTGSAAQAPTLSNAPALSAANMTSFPLLNQNTTGTAAGITTNGTANQVWTMTNATTQGWATPSATGGATFAANAIQYANSTTAARAADVNDLYLPTYAAATGTANAIILTLNNPAPTTISVAGVTINFSPSFTNTGATTISIANISGAAAGNNPVVKSGGVPLVAGDLTSTALATVKWNGSKWELQNPQTTTQITPANYEVCSSYTGNTVTTTGNVAVTCTGTLASSGHYRITGSVTDVTTTTPGQSTFSVNQGGVGGVQLCNTTGAGSAWPASITANGTFNCEFTVTSSTAANSMGGVFQLTITTGTAGQIPRSFGGSNNVTITTGSGTSFDLVVSGSVANHSFTGNNIVVYRVY